MTPGSLGGAVRLLCGLDDTSISDRQLLEAFAAGDRTESFGRLVERHGPMVYGVCKRVLRNAADADDAFQATFLVLAKQAASRDWHDSVANYLYGVAYRTAIRARGRAARRKHHEERVPPRADCPPDDCIDTNEVRSVVDEELTRLPEKFRLPLVLCCLHDRTVEEAATTLGLPATTVKGRLQQGRDVLRERLAGRGITIGASVLTGVAFGGTASAMPPALVTQTVQLAVAGSGTELVAALTNEEFAMLFWKKAKMLVAVLAAFAALGGGIMAMTTSAALPTAAAPVPPTASPMVSRPKASEPAEKNGLRVTVRPTKAAFGPNEQPQFEVLFTNTTEKVFRIYDVGMATDIWHITKAGESDPWQSGPFRYAARPAPATFRLEPEKGAMRTEVVYPKFVRGPFVWKGEQLASPKPLDALPPGKYTAVLKLSCPAVRDNNPIPIWSGELDTKPVEFTIADKPVDVPGPIVVKEDPNGATVKAKVGQTIEVRLVSEKKLEGWEDGNVPEGSTVVKRTDSWFNPAPNGNDESVGTYRFAYTASAEGSVTLDFVFLSPSGPMVINRDKTSLLRKFAVTLEVTK